MNFLSKKNCYGEGSTYLVANLYNPQCKYKILKRKKEKKKKKKRMKNSNFNTGAKYYLFASMYWMTYFSSSFYSYQLNPINCHIQYFILCNIIDFPINIYIIYIILENLYISLHSLKIGHWSEFTINEVTFPAISWEKELLSKTIENDFHEKYSLSYLWN